MFSTCSILQFIALDHNAYLTGHLAFEDLDGERVIGIKNDHFELGRDGTQLLDFHVLDTEVESFYRNW